MRRALCALAIAVLTFAPDARAGCETASQIKGAAPLTVTFTTCEATAHWEFGDGTSADGQTVQHAYAAGLWVAQGGTGSFEIVAEAVSLRVPRLVGYGHRMTLRGFVVPAVGGEPVSILSNGTFLASVRTRSDGTFAVTRRIRSPGPFVARWDTAVSQLLGTTVKPRLDVRLAGAGTVGSRFAVVAKLVPSSAGSVRIRVWRGARLVADNASGRVALSTRRPVRYRVRVTSLPARGFTAPSRTVRAIVALPFLQVGSRGVSVRALEQRLHDLRYALLHVDSYYGRDTYDAVVAFEKLYGLPRTGSAGPALWRILARATVPHARYGGSHVEVDKTRQVLFEVRGGNVTLVVPVSTGATGNTPIGLWHVYSRIAGWSWVLWYPTYFLRGFAIHGYPSVPPYPASHGCVRVPMWVATRLFAMHPYGFPIYIYS